VAIVLDLPERLCAERNAQRPDRDFGPHVIRRQHQQLRRYRNGLPREGFRTVHVLSTPEEVDAATITRARLFNDLRHEQGPFDVIGDVHGCRAELEQLLDKLEQESEEFRAQVDRFIDGLISHYVLDGGRLVVAHAGLIERYHGRTSGRVREFCLYGQTTGETDEYGLPVRYPWVQEYRGRALVLYGHTPVPETEWVNNTLCLDTGCVFGGRLTALNYPERTLVSVPAARVYHPPAKPFPVISPSGDGFRAPARREPDVLDIADVSGSRVIETGYLPRVGLREAHAAAALEVMSRFALDPRWLDRVARAEPL
jgi:hypothetical protein